MQPEAIAVLNGVTLMMLVFSALVCLVPAQDVPTSRADRELELEMFSKAQAELVDKTLEAAEKAIQSAKTRDIATYHIRMLSRLRSPRAVDFLVANLTFQPHAGDIAISVIPTPEEWLPCVYGLSEIGSASFPALLTKLQESDDVLVHQFGALVFRECLGKDQATTSLRHAATKLPAGVKRIRLEAAIACVEKAK